MKIFMLLSAIPGSGKSTWAEQYKLTHENVHIVASDTLRKEIGGAYQNFEHEDEVWDRYFKDIIKCRDLSEDVIVIGDSTNITNKHRKFYGQNITGFDKKILVIFRRDLDTVLKYNKERMPGRIVPEEAVLDIFSRWEEPDEETLALYDEVIEVKNFFDADKVKTEFHYK